MQVPKKLCRWCHKSPTLTSLVKILEDYLGSIQGILNASSKVTPPMAKGRMVPFLGVLIRQYRR